MERADSLLRIEGTSPNGTWRIDSDQVVNALWENRIAFDRMIGVNCPPGWVHRLKYRVIAKIPGNLRGGPSATMVLGPYGDVVVRADGTAYLSWYPVGLQGWTHEMSPPAAWNSACRGEVEETKSQSLARDILGAIDAWYPGMGKSRPILVDAGAIVAYGKTDVERCFQRATRPHANRCHFDRGLSQHRSGQADDRTAICEARCGARTRHGSGYRVMQSGRPLVSVVIATYNRADILHFCHS